jgi:hypothetical protein
MKKKFKCIKEKDLSLENIRGSPGLNFVYKTRSWFETKFDHPMSHLNPKNFVVKELKY